MCGRPRPDNDNDGGKIVGVRCVVRAGAKVTSVWRAARTCTAIPLFSCRYSAWKQPSPSTGLRARSRRRRVELSMGAQDMTHAPAAGSQPIGTLLCPSAEVMASVCPFRSTQSIRPSARPSLCLSLCLLTSLFPCTLSAPSWAHLNKILFALAYENQFSPV